jgi:signal transduction histidine kinase
MWWHFVNEFYQPTQLARESIHNHTCEAFDNKSSARQPNMAEASMRCEAAIALKDKAADDLLAAQPISDDLQPVTDEQPNICTDNLDPFLSKLAKEGKTAFAVWSNPSGFHLFSENFEAITGMPNMAMAGEQWILALSADHQYQVHRMLEIASEEILPSQIMVETRPFEQDTPRHLIMNITPVKESQGKVMVLFYDVTAQKQLEEALSKAEISLKKANRSRSAFLSCLSHELRTPLNAIMGFSEMMREGVLGELNNDRYSEYADHIHSSGADLLGKISNLLDIAALDTGGMAPDLKPCSLHKLLDDLREMHTHAAFEKHITIALDIAQELTLQIDGKMLQSALSQIMQNALEHGREKSTLHISAKSQTDGALVIAIRDRGTGIAPSKLANIRTALRAEATYFEIDEDGIGMGLSMAKEILDRHGANLSIDSMPSRGTIICLTLPPELIRSTPGLQLCAQESKLH